MSNANKTYEINVPVLPESVSDAVVISWYKQVGEYIERDEPIVDIETDKVVLEVPSPVSGVLQEIIEPNGSTVLGRQLLGVIREAEASDVNIASKQPQLSNQTEVNQTNVEKIISPAARKLIIENSLDSDQIPGTGKDGRILKEDVLNILQIEPEETFIPELVKINEPESSFQADKSFSSSRQDRRVPMTRLRARIAQRLLDAQKNAAILTTFNEVNMQAVMDLRHTYKELFEQTHEVKLGFMSFFIKASIEALKQFPAVNASIDGNDIVYHDYYDIGVAVSSPQGLVVPILKNAESLTMAGIEQKVKELAIKARDKQLGLDEITGGSFSVTNGGVFGSLLSTPILNPPQSAILGMHKIQDRAVVENGDIVIRPVMYLALSYDHRIIDGREAVQFLVTVKDFIEDPARLLLII